MPRTTSRPDRPAVFAVVLAFALAAAPSVLADPCPSVDQLGWIAGRWLGKLGEADVEEMVGPPMGGTMVGTFRAVDPPKEGEPGGALRVSFYELFSIEQSDEGPNLVLLHFHPGLIGWEEKGHPLVFRCVDAGERRITWQVEEENGPVRLTYHSPNPDELIATLEEGGKTLTFPYRRAK
jgi:hypothetical protein